MNSLLIRMLFLSAVTLFSVGCQPEHAPKIVFEKTTHEFPNNFIVNTYDEIRATFTFRNKGNAPLNIQGLDADCGCIATNSTDAPYIDIPLKAILP